MLEHANLQKLSEKTLDGPQLSLLSFLLSQPAAIYQEKGEMGPPVKVFAKQSSQVDPLSLFKKSVSECSHIETNAA